MLYMTVFDPLLLCKAKTHVIWENRRQSAGIKNIYQEKQLSKRYLIKKTTVQRYYTSYKDYGCSTTDAQFQASNATQVSRRPFS